MHNHLRNFAGIALLALMAGLAVFNVVQWLSEGFFILALIALCAELIGFVMAVMVEIAIRSKRYIAATVCGLILTVCAGFNVVGAERAWDASMERHLEASRLEAQSDLDAERRELSMKLATANEQIAAYANLLPDAHTPRARQRGMQEAWDRATSQARRDAERAQAQLDDMAVVATVAAPFDPWQVQIGFALAELIKALGLWACGFGAMIVTAAVTSETKRSQETQPETVEVTEIETPVETPVTNVINLRERALQLRNDEALSYSKIGAKLGCSKKHAWMLVNATN